MRKIVVSFVAVSMLALGMCGVNAQEKQPRSLDASEFDENGVRISPYYEWMKAFQRTSGVGREDICNGEPITGQHAYLVPFPIFSACKDYNDRCIAHYRNAHGLSEEEATRVHHMHMERIRNRPNDIVMLPDTVKNFGPTRMGIFRPFMLQVYIDHLEKGTPKPTIYAPSTGVNLDSVPLQRLKDALEGQRHEQRGDELAKQGKWDEALTAYKKSLEYNPAEWEIYRSIAVCYGMLGHKQKARHYFEVALADPWVDRANVEGNIRDMEASFSR